MLVTKGILNRLKLIATDVDGVLTDGHAIIDSNGHEQKRIYFRDLDAIAIGKKLGLEFALITGEDNGMVDVIAKRFNITQVSRGAKDKLVALRTICSVLGLDSAEVCYIGDSDRDAPAIAWAGFGVAPANGSNQAKTAADYITVCKGGDGVLAEVVDLAREKNG
ncbi:HAD family hydrolase [Desulfosporosinus fructosivorans]|uniref:HAD family hydrolase n=1 Tax=Desulfosporosinus fructosivorans TaxID=2018669 RepID=A0A4Z0R180_9FIRM|nr:HAD hydrolase family protein [Desulfosporosinus fructosivorans]TGE35386.1 HAD family hydrolase [Desulfosporosinus fructosivorans]